MTEAYEFLLGWEVSKDARPICPDPAHAIELWIADLKSQPEYKDELFALAVVNCNRVIGPPVSANDWGYLLVINCELEVAERLLDLEYDIEPCDGQDIKWRRHEIAEEPEPEKVFTLTPFQKKLVAKHHLYNAKDYRLERLFKTADEWFADWALGRTLFHEAADARYSAIIETLLAFGRTY